MKTISRRKLTALLLAAVMLLTCISVCPEVYAEDTAVREPAIIFTTYDSRGGVVRCISSGKLYAGEDRCLFYPYMSDYRSTLHVSEIPDCSYTSLNPDIVEIEKDSGSSNITECTVKCKAAGDATIQIDIPSDDQYQARTIYCDLEVVKLSLVSQKFYKRVNDADGVMTESAGLHYLVPGETDQDSFSFDLQDQGAGLRLENTNAVYSSSDEKILTIDSASGDIVLKSPGRVLITASVPESEKHQAGLFYCSVNVTGPDTGSDSSQGESTGGTANASSGTDANAGTSTAATAAAATTKTTVKTAAKVVVPKLTKPTLKCSKRMKKANKLTWSKVKKATGYQLYIKYPGKKKYVKALTKSASVKSVTHRGLSRKKKYSYKIRAYVKIGGKYYYGPFSKAITVKVK